jgi:hypothetical protein
MLCPNQCETCSTFTTCLTCSQGFSSDVVTNECFNTPNNCIQSSRKYTCDVCATNFILKNGNCYNFSNSVMSGGCNYGEFRDDAGCVTDCTVDKYPHNMDNTC